ncbi:aminoglycoside phosphotransferase family protein [Actinosynnema sp. NPDC020468]|uniref:aminoglycoside phosphotransferase family protein n=1 Tax=Actinosynnema sp. NPDC020468 TaxID=3154488 RepID=UPI0033F52AC8
MITVPADFAVSLGPEALAWRATLPALAARFCARWNLTPDGDVLHGFVALVLPVRAADGMPAVLKLTFLDEETRDEPRALRAWDGDGAVRLYDHDDEHGALLLERLDPARSLEDEPIDAAVAVIGGLMGRLRVPGTGFRRYAPTPRPDPVLPADLVAHAHELGAALAAAAGDTLVNEDLHYGNVLRGGREPWLVIDPKPLSGDPEYGVVPLLWNRFDEYDGPLALRERLAAVVDTAGLDPDRARGWAFHRAVVNHTWALEHGEEPFAARCAAIARALRPRD